jgi:hypothetical protein
MRIWRLGIPLGAKAQGKLGVANFALGASPGLCYPPFQGIGVRYLKVIALTRLREPVPAVVGTELPVTANISENTLRGETVQRRCID